MNVDEAIAHAFEKADQERCLSLNSQECKEQHIQLAIWLIEVKLIHERVAFEAWGKNVFLEVPALPTPEYRAAHLQE